MPQKLVESHLILITMQVDEQKFTILYHGNCIDGWFSAYIAYNALQSKGPIQTRGISPNQVRTWPTPQEMAGTHIMMLDISVPQEYRDEWMKKGALSILCIDHHASSMDHWSHEDCPIHVEQCAALQTYQHFYPGSAVPGWLHAIDRIDRWENVSYEDRCMREIMSDIAHKPIRSNVRDAMEMSAAFVHDMNIPDRVSMHLAHGKTILDQKDATLMKVLQKGTTFVVNDHIITQWSLPSTWLGIIIFVLDNSNISIDTTEAAHLFFLHRPDGVVFINYRKQQLHGKPKPQYIFSARSRGLDITQGTILKGHPSAAGAMVVAEQDVVIPFVLPQ